MEGCRGAGRIWVCGAWPYGRQQSPGAVAAAAGRVRSEVQIVNGTVHEGLQGTHSSGQHGLMAGYSGLERDWP